MNIANEFVLQSWTLLLEDNCFFFYQLQGQDKILFQLKSTGL